MEALKYHLLPERRLAMQSSRTKPRKSTVGVLYAVGGMDCTKGKYCFANCHKNCALRLHCFIYLVEITFVTLSICVEVSARNLSTCTMN